MDIKERRSSLWLVFIAMLLLFLSGAASAGIVGEVYDGEVYKGRMYRVERGDTQWEIYESYCGKPKSLEEVQKTIEIPVRNPRRLQANRHVVLIPASCTVGAPAKNSIERLKEEKVALEREVADLKNQVATLTAAVNRQSTEVVRVTTLVDRGVPIKWRPLEIATVVIVLLLILLAIAAIGYVANREYRRGRVERTETRGVWASRDPRVEHARYKQETSLDVYPDDQFFRDETIRSNAVIHVSVVDPYGVRRTLSFNPRISKDGKYVYGIERNPDGSIVTATDAADLKRSVEETLQRFMELRDSDLVLRAFIERRLRLGDSFTPSPA